VLNIKKNENDYGDALISFMCIFAVPPTGMYKNISQLNFFPSGEKIHNRKVPFALCALAKYSALFPHEMRENERKNEM
jgi:hypothetical protein